MNKELRTLVAQELRATGSDKQPRIEGYAATFSGIADLGGFKEKIAPGAFTRTLADGDEVVFLVDHNPSAILGRLSAGTLRLQQDSKGLRFEVDLPPTTVAADAHANLKAGNLQACSFGFSVDGPDGETWEQMSDGSALRTLLSVRLFDCSVVTYPAYTNTSASARNVVGEHVEARMASLTLAQGTEARRQKADALLAEIAQEQADEDTKHLKLRYTNLFN